MTGVKFFSPNLIIIQEELHKTVTNNACKIDVSGKLRQILSRQPNLKVIDAGLPVSGLRH